MIQRTALKTAIDIQKFGELYTRRYVYIRLPFDADKLEIETIDREFLALVHLSYEIESSNGQKKIRGARNR